jgi:Subtilase family
MRSNSTESDSKRSTKGSKSRLPLALTAIVAVFALATAADAAQRMGSSGGFAGMAGGFGGRMGGFGGKLGSGGGTISAITGVPGRPGGKLTKGGTTGSDGGRPSAGNHGKDRPHKPRFPKGPIIVGVPTGVTVVTPVLGAVNPSGGGSPSPARIIARTGSGVPPATERRYRRDEVLTQFAASVPNETITALGRRQRLNRVASFTFNDVTMLRWKIPDQRSVPAVIRSLEAERIVLVARRGNHIAVAAPGVDLLLPAPKAGYQVTTGTSCAAAEVSGIVALLLERKSDLGHEGVRKALTATARDLGPKGIDPQFGAGLVDAYRAILSLEPVTTRAAAPVAPTARR